MDQTLIIAVVAAAVVGLAAVILILRRSRRDVTESDQASRFAASSEGEKRCPSCGMGNLWTEDRCIACGAKLPS
jgi:hypothetical protein